MIADFIRCINNPDYLIDKEFILWTMTIENNIKDNGDASKLMNSSFMESVYAQLLWLLLAMRSYTVLATCILQYKYDIILKALFVFNCLILYWISTIVGEYQSLPRVRILANDINLHKSSWNRILMIESYPNSSKQINAAKSANYYT